MNKRTGNTGIGGSKGPRWFCRALVLASTVLVWGVFFLAIEPTGHAALQDSADPDNLERILAGIENRYGGKGFSARFDQTSTLKAIDVTDKAHGALFVKPPGMMRWEYEAPNRQLIVTDGKTLWIYRPEDNQVMVGDAPEYFGGGKGASFLSDIRMIRENFDVRLIEAGPGDPYERLELIPRKEIPGLSKIQLTVRKDNFDVVRVTTYNPYGDETVIEFSRLELNQSFEDSFFRFQIPPGVDVLQLENQTME